MSKLQLSKSTYIKGLQCHKALYLHKHHYQLKDKISAEQQAIFNRGNKVGRYAQKLFVGGTEVFVKRFNFANAAQETQDLIAKGITTIYEAVFIFNDVIVIVDIFTKVDEKWMAYEVKSSLKITSTYINDVALQYYIIKHAFPDLYDIFLVNINAQYVKNNKIIISDLFQMQSAKAQALAQWDVIAENINTLKNVIIKKDIPEVEIGTHCFTPYSCDFKTTCWGEIPAESVFELTEIPITQKLAWYTNGYRTIASVATDPFLNASHQIQVNATLSNEISIQDNLLKKFFAQVKYPLGFLDFEAIMPAIPLFNGHKPYQLTPFLYSLHSKKSLVDDLEHHTFIAEIGISPEESFLIDLVNQTKHLQSILVYDTGLEFSVLNLCKTLFPNSADEIEKLKSKIIDMKEIFEKRYFYHPQSNGSTKLKNLAACVLKEESPFIKSEIKHGVEALAMYEDLQFENDIFKIIKAQDDLKLYCKADTEALVEIYNYIRKYINL